MAKAEMAPDASHIGDARGDITAVLLTELWDNDGETAKSETALAVSVVKAGAVPEW